MRRAYVRRKKRYSPVDIILSAILILCGLICLGPILNTVAISFSDKTSAAMGKVLFQLDLTGLVIKLF